MLKRLILGSLLLASLARAAPPRDRLRLPERLTIGAADQFMGALSPDGRRLFFVSGANATLQIFSQDLEGGPATLLFDEAADCTSPSPSPDGKTLAYLSFRDDATGDVCVRDLETLQRRCLTDGETAENDVVWAGADRLVALTRQGLHEDTELDSMALGGGSRQALLFRELASPAISPDGRWLAYVPTARASEIVGPSFASRTVGALAFQRFDRLRDRPVEVKLALPGASGFPAFSSDGRWLYFAQYLDDSNLDGTIDALDKSALFRVPFDGDKAVPIEEAARLHPEQLTSVGWNCQYPAPGPIASDRLIATCSLAGSLDVYSLPLDGALPPEWDQAKLAEELAATADRGERLFLAERLLSRSLSPEAEAGQLEEVLRLHLDRGALESARFALDRLRKNGRRSPALLELLGELVAHRGAERALDRGQLSTAFVAEARARLARVERSTSEGEAGALRALVRSELLDVLSDKQGAVEALRSITLTAVRTPLVLQLIATRGADLYTQLDRRAALLELQRGLASHEALDERGRLTLAERYVETLLRGAPFPLHDELIDEALRRLPPEGELTTRLRLERLLSELVPGASTETVERLRKESFELYRRAESFERRRMIVHVTVTRAAAVDSEKLLYDFANAWVSLMKRGTAERRYAERLYRDVVLERAYIELRGRRPADARGRFYGVTLQTDSLEAWTGFLELRATEDAAKARVELESRFAQQPDHPVLRFGRAYLGLRELGALQDPAAKLARLDEAIAHLKVAARSLTRSTELNFLWGHCLYVRYLATGDRAFAQEASTKLLLALDLAFDNARYRASASEQLGRLQATVGNHRIALGQLEARDRLPFVDPVGELAHLVTEARSLQLIDREAEASARIERGLALTTRPELARFRPLLLDRAALHHLAGGAPGKAVERYDELLRLLPTAMVTPVERERIRYTAQLGRGAARLADGHPREAARELAEAYAQLDRQPAVARPPSTRPTSLPPDRDPERSYHLLLSGLRAEAHRRTGELKPAWEQQARRRDLLRARYKDWKADEDLLALGESEAQLGEIAATQGRLDEARARYGAALTAAERYAALTGTEIHPLRTRCLADLVTLRLRTPGARGDAALEKKLDAVLAVLAKQPNPAWARARTTLERDLTALRLQRNDVP